MRVNPVLTICIVALLTCSAAFAQETCDFTTVGKNMESAAAQGDWESAYAHAQQIVVARPDDISALSADEQYWLGLAHLYMMAQAFDLAEEGLQDSRSEFASEMRQMVLNPYEDVRVISQGERVTLTDYLVPGQYVIFDFYSKYCGPCVQVGPMIESLARERDDVVLVKVDINRPGHEGIDWQSPVAQQYNLRGIPYFNVYGPDGELAAEGQQARTMVIGWLQEMEG